MKRNSDLRYGLLISFFLCLSFLSGCLFPVPFSMPKPPLPNSNGVFPDFAELITRVAPSVVAISTESITYDSLNHQQTEAGSGSGWIIDTKGTIVTNNHVIDGATSITVELYDHQAYHAELVSADPATDIAVLRIRTDHILLPLNVANTSNLRVGDWVIVIGNPLGMGISAKQGIISRLDVNMSSSPEQMYYNMIETSAAINPGNSGGPLINLDGEVIGITSLKIDAAGIEGMGYAIAMNEVVPIIQTLAKGERIIRPWLGVNLIGMNTGLTAVFNLNISDGALIVDVSKDSPADKVGLKLGDVIVAYNDQPVTDDDQLIRLIRGSKIGQKVRITFWRGEEQKTVEAVLAESPPQPTTTNTPATSSH
jgi:serine protease Do